MSHTASVTEPRIRRVDYRDPRQAAALLQLLNEYARDPMGGGQPLAPEVLRELPARLAALPHAFSLLAWAGDHPAGLVNCFEGFSTFAARPLVNIHDLVVRPDYRGRGIAGRLLEAVETIARGKGCCKLTLEVLAGNRAAQSVYRRHGFAGYALDPATGQAEFWQKPLDA